ncbi:MAG: DUF4294 domain-containing protein [Bacteroidales bacterium]|nr:DUF4294 domain-containing protein [Bacteroidales bacterium]
MRLFFHILFITLLFGVTESVAGNKEHPPEAGITMAARVTGTDTILVVELQPVDVVAPREFRNRREARRFDRLARNVKTVYPLVRIGGLMFEDYVTRLEAIEDERERKRFLNQAEKEVREHFEADLRRLTFSQGHILIKLIDREIQRTSYDLLREFRGSFSAVFWQSLGRLFGYNLRTEYDPEGEDAEIEEIIRLIEAGLI